MTESPAEYAARRLSGVIAERPRHEPPLALPVSLRSVQRSNISPGKFDPPLANRILLVKWVIAGEAAMELHGQRFHFGPGDIAICTPGVPHAFWAVAPVNEMCWFTVDGPLVEPFARHLDLSPGVYPYGAAPLQQIAELTDSLTDHSQHGRRRSSLLAIALLYDIGERVGNVELPAVVRQAQHIIEAEFANAELSTEGIAGRLNYHRGSLSRLFHQHTGVTIIDYMTHVRLQEARLRLSESTDKVAEVGRRCGFRDPTYFCRWVRKHTGLSPKQLRLQVSA
ncbi:MAG TPA: AraC family transcriptional regulator [Tepidisphaeraceae bacterium]|nr:AraC family transcriptional regulator [Tepidisphaeraceae bacterium]